MPHLYLTHAQHTAAKIVMGHLPGPVNWDDWASFKAEVVSAPLDTDEETEAAAGPAVDESAA